MSNTNTDSIWAEREQQYTHERLILRSRQVGRKVRYRNAYAYVATVCLHKGDVEMTVYLEGSSEPVRPCDISIPETLPD